MQKREDTTQVSSTLQAPTRVAMIPSTRRSKRNAVISQPMSQQQQPVCVQPMVPNDHLCFTVALMFLCLLTCNYLGALCLMPALICASKVRARQQISRALGLSLTSQLYMWSSGE